MRGSRATLALAAVLTGACGPHVRLPAIETRHYDRPVPLRVGLYVPPTSAEYVESGWFWLGRYRVDLGDALEANAMDALGRAFRAVVLEDAFPDRGDGAPLVAIEVQIASSSTSLGWLFAPCSARVVLRARVAVGGRVRGAPLEVTGSESRFPPSLSQGSRDRTMQYVVEEALGVALDELAEAVLERLAEPPA